MIIDSHAHIAHWPTLKESEECIEESNKKYLIGFTLVSDCDCSEYPSVDKYGVHHVSQLQGLRTTLAFVKKDPQSFGAMVWVNPHNEVVTPALEKCIEENRQYIYGLKFHPYESHLRITSVKFQPYLDLARKFHLPIQVHTAQDRYSDVLFLGLVAAKNPDLKFIAAHMQLVSDNHAALEVLKNHPNVYGDTAWVDIKIAKKVLTEIGEDRILFGSDNPIDGVDTLGNPIYEAYLRNKAKLPGRLYHNLMYRNAQKLFGIQLKKAEK
jgi:predicted TIM-barrel fold metal-dependent hydrolase